MYCNNCGKQLPESSNFCNRCGAEQHRQSRQGGEMCYCYNCGEPLTDGVNFCSVCGADQRRETGSDQQSKKPFTAFDPYEDAPTVIEPGEETTVIDPDRGAGWTPDPGPKSNRAVLIAVVAGMVIMMIIACFAIAAIINTGRTSSGESVLAESTAEEHTTALVPTATTAETTVPPTTQAPLDGWVEIGGATYFYKNNKPVTGRQTIEGIERYFDESGKMLKNTSVDIDEGALNIDANGVVVSICFAKVSQSWSDKKYTAHGGSCSIMDIEDPVENCTSFGFYIEAEGLYGSSCEGTWKIYIRVDGQWQQAGTFELSDGYCFTTITLDSPTSFDAVTAYPTRTGNASYQCGYVVYNVTCNLE